MMLACMLHVRLWPRRKFAPGWLTGNDVNRAIYVLVRRRALGTNVLLQGVRRAALQVYPTMPGRPLPRVRSIACWISWTSTLSGMLQRALMHSTRLLSGICRRIVTVRLVPHVLGSAPA